MKYKPDFLIKPYFLYEDKEIKPLDRDVFAIIYYFVKMKGKKCTAGNSTMAKLINSSAGSIANSLVKLEKLGYIKRIFKDEKKLVRSEIIPLVNFTRVSSVNEGGFICGLRGVSSVDEQISNNNKEKNNIVETSSTKRDDSKEPMNLQEFIKSMKEPKNGKEPKYPIIIIAEWADTIRPNLKTKGQWKEFLKRNLRPANSLKHFPLEDIEYAYKKAKSDSENSNGFSVTLETIIKYLTK